VPRQKPVIVHMLFGQTKYTRVCSHSFAAFRIVWHPFS